MALADPSGPLLVGIDLGTTNSALAWSDPGGAAQVFEVPQLIAAGETGRAGTLPSFVYFPTTSEQDAGLVALPWAPRPAAVVGQFAREHGALVPARLVSSAKSWLANASVDRTAALLPFGAEEGPRISPVAASATVLRHLRDAWNATAAAADERRRLERQAIVLTVPASFDDEARELTVEAAREAGLDDVTLLEEPIAALYAWIAGHRRALAEQLPDGALVLVCDVGGGTTDLSLMRASIEDGELRFERIAIGEHLLLGGDNVDLALAAGVESALAAPGGARLTLAQRQMLRRKASAAKEQLLGGTPPEQVTVTILGAGRGVVGGGMTATLTRETAVATLLDGFLPLSAASDLPTRDRRAALRELGLPYESEPAITRHLAAFLTRAGRESATAMARPDAVLFNGGFFTAAIARERVLDALAGWFGARPQVLENDRPEAAVAIGAAFYSRLRRHPDAMRRLLIRAGTARTYYVGVRLDDGRSGAVCVMPRGTQEGTTLRLDRPFTVTTNGPAAFTLYSALSRDDQAGETVPVDASNASDAGDDSLHRHAPLVTVLRFGKRSRRVPIGVRLSASFTETGTLELWCEAEETEHRWRLAFNLRTAEADPFEAAAADGNEAATDQAVIGTEGSREAAGLIRAAFAPAEGGVAVAPEALTGELERVLGFGKAAWPLATIRQLADVLLELAGGRGRSAAHEIRWLNLTGYCIRPGFGATLDAFRISELRKVYAAGLVFPKDVQTQVEWLVLWQRVAAGFTAGHQRELAQRVAGQLGAGQKKGLRLNPQIEREGWRLLGSLERLDASQRSKLGDELLDRLKRDPRNRAWVWAMGRLGARLPFYGPLSSVVSAATAERWIERLLAKSLTEDGALAVVQIAALTGDPARDIADSVRSELVIRLAPAGLGAEALRPLTEIVPAAGADTAQMFGESLPEGLTLVSEQGPRATRS